MKTLGNFRYAFPLLLLLTPPIGQAQIPREIFYQGVLTDSTGAPKADGSYTFVFTLYSDSTGTTSVWSSGSRSLTVKSGLFYTALAFPSTVAFDQKYWLGIAAGGDILSPRIPLSSVAYSIASIRSDTAGYALASAQQAYSAGAGLSLTGTTFSIANGGIVGAMMADAAVTSAKIANETISSSDIDANAVTTSELLDDAVTMAKIAQSGAGTNQVIKWTGTGWAPRNDSLGLGATYGAGAGLALTGSVFSIGTGGVTNLMLRDSSLTVTAGKGLSGGGVVSPGGSVVISHADHGGDVAGSGNLTVTGLQGRAVNGTAPQSGYVLKWNGLNSTWEPSIDVSGGAGGIGGNGTDNTIPRFRGSTTLESSAIYDSAGNIGIGTATPQSKLDVSGTVQMTGLKLSSALTNGYVLTSDADGDGMWLPVPPPSGTAGGDLTGTYPSPTIAADAVNTAEIVDAAVTSAKIADNAVGNTEMANNAVGNAEMADNAVNTAEMVDDAVTMAKIAQAGAGTNQVIKWTGTGWAPRNDSLGTGSTYSAGSGLTLTGTTFSVANLGIVETMMADAAVTSLKIADNAVGNTEMANNAIGNAEMADNAVNTVEIVDSAVTGLKIRTGAVGSSKIADNAVGSQKILDESILAADIAPGGVTNSEILDGTITSADIGADVIVAGDIATGGVATAEILDGTILAGDLAFAVATRPLTPGVSSAEILDDAITSADIGPDVIVAGDIASGGVGTAEILDGTITSADIGADVIVAGDIATGGVATAEILDGTITSADIGTDVILAGDIATGAVTTTEILDRTIIGVDIATTASLAIKTLTMTDTLTLQNLPIGGGSLNLLYDLATSRVFRSGSSRRYKTNIETLVTDPNRVLMLRPVTFDWKSTGQHDVGLIAEEVSETVSDLAIFDENGNPDGVKYDKVAIYLLELVKQQEKRINELEEKVKDLVTNRAGSETKDVGEFRQPLGQ